MSKWKQKGIELFPDLREEIENPENSIYNLFFELLPRVRKAHLNKNQSELEKIYGYAKWCFEKTAKDLWNAPAVGFYEHLVDEEITKKEITSWVTPKMFQQLSGLFKNRMNEKDYMELCNYYEKQKNA